MKPTKLDKDLLKRTNAYAEQVRRLYANAVNDILDISSHMKIQEGNMFNFSEIRRLSNVVSDRLRALHSATYASIKKNIELEWNLGHENLDNLITSNFGKGILKNESLAGWFHRNTEAMDAFLERSDNGIDLSKRVWRYTDQLKDEMEIAMTVSIGQGESASQISRLVRKYLNEPDKLFRRVRDEDGNLKLSKAAKDYRPGQGVYRSSAKNAMRLARSETNMAYRHADNERWKHLDFVLGQEIRLAHDHPEYDICDELQGRYPKDFVFGGWHPQCFCYHVAILLPPAEMLKMQKAIAKGEKYDIKSKMVKDVPENFKNWVHENEDKLEAARERGKTPYFVKNNDQIVKDIIEPPRALDVAKRRHEARTPEQIESIQKEWNSRRANKKYGNNVMSIMSGISDVDISALEKALNGGDISLILSEAKKLRATGKEIYGLKHIENPMQVAKDFSFNDAKIVDQAVQKKLASWAHLSLKEKQQKLSFEVNWLAENPKYNTWKVAQQAYSLELNKVVSEIYWEDVQVKFSNVNQFKTKSKPYLELVENLALAIDSGNEGKTEHLFSEIENKRNELDKAAERRRRKRTTVGAITYNEMTEKYRENLFKEFMSENDVKELDDKLRQPTIKGWNNLSEEEKRTVTKYTQTFSYLNEPLRGITYYGDRDKIEFKKDEPILTEALNRFKLEQDIVVRRGTNDFMIKELGYNLSDVKPGDIFTDKAFLSTAIHKDHGFTNKRINMVIAVPKGARGIYAEPFSHYTDHSKFNYNGTIWDGVTKEDIRSEVEWIGQKGSMFKVIRVEMFTIYLEIIGQLQ